MPKKPPLTPPAAALPDGEPHRYVARVKTMLCKRWSDSKMETLYEIFDLTAFLWSLDRTDEALAIAMWVARAIPEPPTLRGGGVNYNVWCPATYSHALLVHAGPGAHSELATASRNALLVDPGVARSNSDYLAGNVASAREELTAPLDSDTLKWKCEGLARSLGSMLLISELAAAGDVAFAPHGQAASELVAALRLRLGEKLRTA